MSGIVYKQRYANAGRVPKEAIPGLNVRHLHYIATRPGAVYNEGYGFGLFGSLRPNAPMADITSLEDAKSLVRAESERGRTMFRGIVSMGEPEASEQGFYDRRKWERLIESQMASIAKLMHIAPLDLRWVGAMHCNAGHPHVHLLFWDAGKQPRQDYMPKPVFEQYAERIRAGFNREIYGREIAKTQAEQKENLQELRDELRALFPEANPTGVFPISAMQKSKNFPELCERLQTLVDHAPESGSLKYAYLPSEYKEEVDAFLNLVLRQPAFSKLHDAYLNAAKQVSELYGNGEQTIGTNLKKAELKLCKELGNELMNAVRPLLSEKRRALSAEKRAYVREYLARSKVYDILLKALPAERIPMEQIRQMPEYVALRDDLKELLHADHRWKEEEPDKLLDSVLGEVLREAQSEKGYIAEAQRTNTITTLLRLFASLSRRTGQQQALRRQLGRSHDASREERKDRRVQRSIGSEMNYERE